MSGTSRFSPQSPGHPPVYSSVYEYAHLGIHMNGVIQYMVSCDWPLSLGTGFSRFSHTAANISISSLFIVGSRSIVWMDHINIMFIHPSSDEPLGGFYFLIMNNTAVNVHIKLYFNYYDVYSFNVVFCGTV